MLDFIMKKAGKIEQPMYIVSSTSVIDNKVSEVINKYNLKLTVFDEVEFLDGVKNLLQKEDSDKLEKKVSEVIMESEDIITSKTEEEDNSTLSKAQQKKLFTEESSEMEEIDKKEEKSEVQEGLSEDVSISENIALKRKEIRRRTSLRK